MRKKFLIDTYSFKKKKKICSCRFIFYPKRETIIVALSVFAELDGKHIILALFSSFSNMIDNPNSKLNNSISALFLGSYFCFSIYMSVISFSFFLFFSPLTEFQTKANAER